MAKGLCIVGDIHISDNPAKYKQATDFFKWFLESPYNSEEYDKLFLGDLYDDPEPSNRCVGAVLGFIYSLLGKKLIITGNHDRKPETNALEVFTALKDVTLYDRDTEVDINGLKCLLLPHMDPEVLGLPPLTDYYNEQVSKIYSKNTYDYVFHHLEDETKHFGDKFVDLSNIKGVIVAGHVHTADITEGGHYLGSVCKNSSAEKDDHKYIAYIDYSSKRISLEEIPSFLEYGALEYPNLPSHFDGTTLYTVTKAPTKQDALVFYTKEFANHGGTFYPLLIVSLRNEILYNENNNTKEIISESDYLDKYATENKVSDSILNKCKELI